MIDSLLDFLIFNISLTLTFVFLYNRIFYLLFNYPVSIFLRSYSFWLILLDLLIQRNIEFFTFIICRSIQVMVNFNFTTKLFNTLTILLGFILIICVIGSYAFYYFQYRKLGRYFLYNMYRFPSSYLLMIICDGIKPFLKGLVHAMLY